MDVEAIGQVVRDVFGPIKTEVINGWVSMQCPLSPWTHASGRDSRASSGLSIQPQGVTIFNCFTCGNKMPIQGMLRKYANYTGEDLDSLIEELEEEAYMGPRELPEWDQQREDAGDPTPLKASVYLDLYDPAHLHHYVADRGISPDTAQLLRLMLDPADPADGEERILFPVFGPTGDLYGLSGRATNPDATLKVRDYFGLKKAACLLGIHLIKKDDPYILLVEGLFDYANGWECGVPTVACMHSTLTERQAAILRDVGKPVYLFYDNDQAGQKGVEAAGKLLYQYIPVMKVRYPASVKDPGELTSIEFNEMIADSRLYFP